MPRPSSSLSSLLLSHSLLPSLCRASSAQKSLKAASFIPSSALSTNSHVKTLRFNKDLCWVSMTKENKAPIPLSSKLKEVEVPKYSSSGQYLNLYPEYDRLLPSTLQHSPYRVEHLVVSEGGIVLDYICKALHLPPLYVADLVRFGAVHYALVCPKPPPSASPEEVQIYREFTHPAVLRKRPSIKGKTLREAQKTFRITDVNEFVETGTYLRVHVHPKRFPRCYEVDWKSRIIAVTDLYVVLDKPAAISVGGTTDNIEECCATFASRALGPETPLWTTHQIDNCTEGCVVFARNKDFCPAFHGMIRDKEVKKLYLALAAAPVPVGIISHYMRPVNRAPRIVSEAFLDPIDRWHLCQLEVLECKEVPWRNANTDKNYNIDDCGWPLKTSAYECRINLITGKTHQIRAQLAAIGAPIVGDSIYTPAAMAQMENPHINPFGASKREYTNEEDKEKAIGEWVSCHGKEPNTAIGLQASQISWDGGKVCYEAGTPWWRQRTDGTSSAES